MADELDDMLARAVLRRAPSTGVEEAADIALYFRTLLNNDRRVTEHHLRTQLVLKYGNPGAALQVMQIMEELNG
jgi:hypothetical protein